jgi:hypothetical protein
MLPDKKSLIILLNQARIINPHQPEQDQTFKVQQIPQSKNLVFSPVLPKSLCDFKTINTFIMVSILLILISNYAFKNYF